MSGWAHRTQIIETCPDCGGYITESAYGTGIWDFHIRRDTHECPPGGRTHAGEDQ